MRFLSDTFVEETLSRGKSVEQFLGGCNANSQRTIRWIEIRPSRSQMEVWVFEPPDIGSTDLLDVYEFEGDAGPEQPIRIFQSALEALEYAHAHLGASRDRWVNQFAIQSEYEDYIARGRPTNWP